MSVFNPGSHGSTFGGNALAAAVALEALQVIEDENLVARSAALGDYLIARLREVMQASGGLIRAVRGRGLWVGVDVEPAHATARELVERMAAQGVLSKETHETVIRFAPPLTISKALIDKAVGIFREVVQGKQKELGIASALPAGATRAQAAAEPAPQLLMSPPDFFEVAYTINPWMNPEQWSLDSKRLLSDALAGWNALRATYEALGARVLVKPAAQGWPDLVFTANCAVVLDGKAILARYLKSERAGEELHGHRMFDQLKARGEIDAVYRTPEGVYFEGAGDAIYDPLRKLMWMGWGQRSSRAPHHTVEQVFGIPTLSLELVDPHFYHLDTAFCLLSGGEILYHPAAFSAEGREQIRALVAADKLIEAPQEDADHLAVNSVCIGREIVMCYCSQALRQRLEQRGYRVHVVPLGAFNRSGGAAYCLTLKLNNLYKGRQRGGEKLAA
jgi:N-dimethylarginine dimethylaminohydrolase